MAEMRRYECEYYSVDAPARSCLFSAHCTDVFWDYSNGPYMFLCDADADVERGAVGECSVFAEEVDNG